MTVPPDCLINTSKHFFLPTLAIDTSGPWLTLGIARQGKLVADIYQDCGILANSILLEHLERLLMQCQLRPQELRLIVVAIGPGSFTGVRIGMATAFILAQINNIPIAGVDNLKLLALRSDPNLTSGYFHSWRNCVGEDIYHATWQWEKTKAWNSLKQLHPPCLLPFEQAKKKITEISKKIAPLILECFPQGNVFFSHLQPAYHQKNRAALLLEAGIEQYLQHPQTQKFTPATQLSQFPKPLYLKNEAFRSWKP